MVRTFTERRLHKQHEKYIAQYPKLACFAFDLLGTSVMFHGRFAAEELELLGTQVFPQLPTRNICIDIGAHVGNHSLYFCGHFRKVMAFEPHARTFKLLQLNAELANNIVVANSGASDRKEVAQASEDPLNSGTASVVRSGATEARTGKRPATTFNLDRVDDLIPVADHGNVSFIKIDTEGYELQGLRGMPSILRSSKPVVALEVLKESFDNGKSGAVEYLRELGYSSFYIFREAGWVTLLPKGVRRFLQRIGQATIGRSGYVVELQLAPDLEVRHHSIVLASPFPLKIRR